jgi:transcriptional regulator with XRE-family HTH domain
MSMDKSIYAAEHDRLCDLLRQIRIAAHLRQGDLSARLRKPQSFVSRYESGQRRLDLLELRQICQTVGVSLAEFVERFERSLP